MKGCNVIAVYDKNCEKVLMCKRRKNPYKGLINFVGGKIELNEKGVDAAYRELREETGISNSDIILTHFMDFTYYTYDCYVEVYVGKLNKDIEVHDYENELFWSNLDENFFDVNKYAGEGNLGHIIEHIKLAKDTLLK